MNETNIAMAIIDLLRSMGGWGAGSLLTILLLVPPILGAVMVVAGVRAIRSLERVMVDGMAKTELIAHQMAVKYDNNVMLVEETQKIGRSVQALVDCMLDVVKENTKAITLATARMEGSQGGKR
jgi:hypothetical protein